MTRVPPGHPEGYLEGFANIYAEAARAIRAAKDGTACPRRHHLPRPQGRPRRRGLRRCLRQVLGQQRRLGRPEPLKGKHLTQIVLPFCTSIPRVGRRFRHRFKKPADCGGVKPPAKAKVHPLESRRHRAMRCDDIRSYRINDLTCDRISATDCPVSSQNGARWDWQRNVRGDRYPCARSAWSTGSMTTSTNA